MTEPAQAASEAARKAALFAHTVRHLKPAQIVARVTRRFSRVRPDAAPAPARRAASGHWVSPVARPASLLPEWRVRFLNEDGGIARPEQWNDPRRKKLWLYNLHYFDGLCAADGGNGGQGGRLISRWIAENPPPAGNGWEPYPTSLRIVNWLKWHLGGEALDREMGDSLAMQARWLAGHVEWHLLGNHILANAKALVFAGLFFSGTEADGWLREGLAIYARELPEQVLEDGGHFELSPMYHAIILEDLLDLLNLARLQGMEGMPPFRDLPTLIHRMRGWLNAMTHPDGGPAFFNDTAFGIAPSAADLDAYSARLALPELPPPGEGVHHLAASGYVRVNRGGMAAILDVAAIGPDYIPGHAHADTLSFELSLGSDRVIVNGGTSTYAPGPEREAQRATRAHSTVELAGENSSEVWGSFRVARRARIRDLRIDVTSATARISAAHDGYARLPGRPLHRRSWTFAGNALQVSDDIEGGGRSPALAVFPLGPRISAGRDPADGPWRLAGPDSEALIEAGSEARLVPGLWHRGFGEAVPSASLLVPFAGSLDTRLSWR